MKQIERSAPSGFDLALTLECGQCFRWEREKDGSYSGVVSGLSVNVEQSGEKLIFRGCSREEADRVFRPYFDLDRDYDAIRATLARHDAGMAAAVAFGGGIRLLRQDPWETLVSFIISQNTNIPRIKKCVSNLCAAYGEPVTGWDGRICHAFPDAETLAACPEDTENACRLGYRTPYILETARRIASDGGKTLNAARGMTEQEAEDYLLSLHGVGPKVADCVMLYGLSQYGRFPADVWIRRAMARLYGFRENDAKGIAAFARAEFGPLAGFAQQYLFQYIRYFTEQGE